MDAVSENQMEEMLRKLESVLAQITTNFDKLDFFKVFLAR